MGDAIKCSADRVWDIFYNSVDFSTFPYISRACACWDYYRKGMCNKGQINNYVSAYMPTQEGYKLLGYVPICTTTQYVLFEAILLFDFLAHAEYF